MSEPMRLNLGCGHEPLAGYTNIDLYADEADVKADVRTARFEHVNEVVAYHLLEHLTYWEARALLVNAKSWMRTQGKLTVEVPDMEAIAGGVGFPGWEMYVYGSQEHEGEFHRWGYTLGSLKLLVEKAGWIVDSGRRFKSEQPQRRGMPCIEIRAHAK